MFFARTIIQWALSERAKRIISPSIYWAFSLAGAYLLFIYGWLRDDFSIILGQSITYYIYILNLRLNGDWQKIPRAAKPFLLFTPVVFFASMLLHGDIYFEKFFGNQSLPIGLIVFGSVGQVIFTFRFIYQIIYSYKRKESVLPVGFWAISLCGAVIILIYSLLRLDPILIAGQSLGLLAYVRNVMLHHFRQQTIALSQTINQ